MDEATQPTLGDLVAGRYRLVRIAGQDASCQYFLAEDSNSGTRVTVGLLRDSGNLPPDSSERFLQWARRAATLRDSGMLQVLDAGQTGRVPYVVTEAVEDASLREYIARSAPFATRDTLTVLKQVAATLDYLHGRGIVDGALSSDRILIDRQGHTRIVNPGLMLALNPPSAQGSIDSRADVYLLGTLVYEMLTGRLPAEIPPFASTASTRLDAASAAAIDQVVARALDPLPSRRYPTADAFSQAFETVAGTIPPEEPDAPTRRMPVESSDTVLVPPPPAREPRAVPVRAAPPPPRQEGGAEPTMIRPPGFHQRQGAGFLPGVLLGVVGTLAMLLVFVGGLRLVRGISFDTPAAGLAAIPTITGRPTAAPTPPGPTPTSRLVPLPTLTQFPTDTPGPTDTPTPTPTATSAVTATSTATPAPSRTATPAITPTRPAATPTAAPSAAVPSGFVVVPSVVGLTEEEGQSAIRAAGFNTAQPNYQPFTAQPVGRILSQLPAAGQQAPRGSTVFIAVRR